MNNVYKKQSEVIQAAKKYNKEYLKKNSNFVSSHLPYMTTWTKTPGYYKLLQLIGFNKYGFFYSLKDIISIFKSFSFETISNLDTIHDLEKKIIIVSYCTKNNFDKHGNFQDDYFKISSKKRDYYWFLISLDHICPNKINNNITILKKTKNNKKNFILLLKILFKLLRNLKSISFFSVFSEIVSKNFSNFLSNKNKIKNVLINYEAIPFQHGIINAIKKSKKKINILCYLHCAGWPLQTELLYKEKKIDKIIVSGIEQKKKLINYLSWPEKKVKVIPSLRFTKKKSDISFYSAKIFIPYEIFNENNILEVLENFFIELAPKSINKVKCRIHPLNSESKKHQNLVIKIEKLIKKYSNKFSNNINDKSSIIVGSATGVCVQALENGIKIYHIPNNEILDVFSEKIWKSIEVKKKSNKVYEYKLKRKNQIFMINRENNKFDKYLVPFFK